MNKELKTCTDSLQLKTDHMPHKKEKQHKHEQYNSTTPESRS